MRGAMEWWNCWPEGWIPSGNQLLVPEGWIPSGGELLVPEGWIPSGNQLLVPEGWTPSGNQLHGPVGPHCPHGMSKLCLLMGGGGCLFRSRTSLLFTLHSQQQPCFTLWNGRWKHLPIQSQSPLTWHKHALNGRWPVFPALFLSVGPQAVASCLHTGRTPARTCLMDHAMTPMTSSYVFSEAAQSGRQKRGILSLPFLPGRPGRLRVTATTLSDRS
jgi:hypothetical protein